MTSAQLPQAFTDIRDDFLSLEQHDRLQLLLEFANDLPDLPERYANHPELLERVIECQSPVSIFIEIDHNNRVHFHATAPRESPTTRGFASILAHGIDGLTPKEVLGIPTDYAHTIGLTQAVSLLRIAGMTALLGRAKRQVREKLEATQNEATQNTDA